MIKGAIWYKDGWLAPGSRAHELHTEGKMKELAEHMKEVEERAKALIK